MKKSNQNFMRFIRNFFRTCLPPGLLLPLALCAALTLTAHRPPTDRLATTPRPTNGRPLPLPRLPLPLAPRLASDPIRFTLRCTQTSVAPGQTIDLTITAQLLTIAPNLLFFQPGLTAYSLKLLLPPGFEQTGGDLVDNLSGELAYPARPLMSYHLRGHFRSLTPGTRFRLLRGPGGTHEGGLFVEKANVVLGTDGEGLTVQAEPPLPGGGVPTQTLLIVGGVRGSGRVAAQYRGYLDYAGCDAVSGWVADGNALRQSQSVDIYLNGSLAATVRADQRRWDVAGSLGVSDFADYGYVWVIPAYYRAGASLRVVVRVSGTGVELTNSPHQTGVCGSAGVPPPPPPVTTPPVSPPPVSTPPVTTPPVSPPPAGGALTLLAPVYQCATGAITFRSSGGDGSAVRYRSPGISDWSTNPNQYLDQGSRVNADTPPFTLYAEQSGRIVTYGWSRQATCNGTPPPVTTPPVATPPVTTPPVSPPPVSTPPVTTPPVSPPPVTTPPATSTSGYYGYRGDTFHYTPLPPSPTTDPFPVFETDKIKVTLALRTQYPTSTQPGMGGSVYQLYNKDRPNHTLIFNAGVWDSADRSGPPNRVFTGQGLSECLYQLPRPYDVPGETGQPAHDPTLGYNPNEVGDDVMASGRLLAYGRSANSFYTEMRPMLYGQRQAPAHEVLMRKWGQVLDRALILNYETTFSRSSGERPVTKGQEAPCLYVNNLSIFKYYNGDRPYTGDGITTFAAPASPYGNAGGSQADNKNGQRPGGQYVTEPWIGVFGADGYGIALMLKDNIRSFIGYWGDGGGNNANPNLGGSNGYIAHAMNEILDLNIKWRHRTEVIVGTVEEIRAYVYANAYRPATKPAYTFNTAGREGWSLNSGDGDDRHTWDEPYTGQARSGWKVYFGPSSNAVLSSPGVTWTASSFNKIYVRMAYTGGETQWSFRFRRNRQKGDGALDYSGKHGGEEGARYPDGSSDRVEQTQVFGVVGDGQYRVYEIDLSRNLEWRNIINEVYLKPHARDGVYAYPSGESAIIDWIGTTPGGPGN